MGNNGSSPAFSNALLVLRPFSHVILIKLRLQQGTISVGC